MFAPLGRTTTIGSSVPREHVRVNGRCNIDYSLFFAFFAISFAFFAVKSF